MVTYFLIDNYVCKNVDAYHTITLYTETYVYIYSYFLHK